MTHTHRKTRARERWRGLIVLLGVIVLHIGPYAVLRHSSGWQVRHATAPMREPVTLRLLPWREPVAARAQAGAVASVQPAQRPRNAPASITISAPRAITPAASPPDTVQADAAPQPALPASQPPRPLDLTLPRGYAARPAARNPAIDDLRANTARTTPERRMAAALDTRVIEEDLGDGRRRFRQGDKCVIVKQSRIGQLMPFNEAAARSPSLVGACP